MTPCDTRGCDLAVPMGCKKGLEIPLGNPHQPIYPVCDEQPIFDPAPDSSCRYFDELGDLLNRVDFVDAFGWPVFIQHPPLPSTRRPASWLNCGDCLNCPAPLRFQIGEIVGAHPCPATRSRSGSSLPKLALNGLGSGRPARPPLGVLLPRRLYGR
jgi:hypothetical protein